VSETASALTAPVEQFVTELGPILERVAAEARMQPGSDQPAAHDVLLEAYNLACAFIDADGLHTDEELWALIETFGPRFDTQLGGATPGDVRKARLVVGRAQWLKTPSLLFEILLGDDHRHRTRNTWRYYSLALDIAHTVSSIDAHPSMDELKAIEEFRGMLLHRMDNWEVPRPGTVASDGAAPPATSNQPDLPDLPATSEQADLPPARPIDSLLAELDALVGLAPVKAEVKLVTALLQVQRLRKKRGLPVVESSHHLVFTGNPGTGKTTVARLLAQIYRTLEVVSKGQLVESDRSQLVAGFVGQTAIQVRDVVTKALGGVLLIDEAYALARGDEHDFGQEAIDTLVKLMEDHRDELAVIAAGYPDEMHEFIESNPGLRSRFPKTIDFPDYATDELVAIFDGMCKEASYKPTPEAVERVRAWFDSQPRDKGFGNARLARNLFEAACARQAERLMAPPAAEHAAAADAAGPSSSPAEPTDEQLTALLPDDIAAPSI
jgi:Cdc6-like AAA superfamily ATPase